MGKQNRTEQNRMLRKFSVTMLKAQSTKEFIDKLYFINIKRGAIHKDSVIMKKQARDWQEIFAKSLSSKEFGIENINIFQSPPKKDTI